MSGGMETEWREEISNDGVIVAGVECNVVAPGFSNGADHINRLIAVERRNLDGDDIFDRRQPLPEGMREQTASRCRLQIESEQRQCLSHRCAVGEQVVIAGLRESSERNQAGMKPDPGG